MSTNASIMVALPDGSIKAVYLHFDGYESYAGKMLLTHYATYDKALELVGYGDISSLFANIGTKHDFGEYQKDMCTFYHRDRGDPLRNGMHSCIAGAKIAEKQDYNYLFISGAWHMLSSGQNWTDYYNSVVETSDEIHE